MSDRARGSPSDPGIQLSLLLATHPLIRVAGVPPAQTTKQNSPSPASRADLVEVEDLPRSANHDWFATSHSVFASADEVGVRPKDDKDWFAGSRLRLPNLGDVVPTPVRVLEAKDATVGNDPTGLLLGELLGRLPDLLGFSQRPLQERRTRASSRTPLSRYSPLTTRATRCSQRAIDDTTLSKVNKPGNA